MTNLIAHTSNKQFSRTQFTDSSLFSSVTISKQLQNLPADEKKKNLQQFVWYIFSHLWVSSSNIRTQKKKCIDSNRWRWKTVDIVQPPACSTVCTAITDFSIAFSFYLNETITLNATSALYARQMPNNSKIRESRVKQRNKKKTKKTKHEKKKRVGDGWKSNPAIG